MRMRLGVRISIIIPVFNVEPYLAECLDSILSQTFCDYEIICVDDGSTDGSYVILQQYAIENARIKTLRYSENKGQSFARNRGIEIATGDYIMFVDSDDMLKQGALEQINRLLDQYKGIDILYYDYETRKEGMWAKEQCESLSSGVDDIVGKISTGQELYIQLEKKDALIGQVWRQVIRREFLCENNISFCEDIYHEDLLYSFYCALNADKCIYINEPLYLYRSRDGSTMSSMNLKRVHSFYMVFIELWNYWKNGSWSEEVSGLLEKYIYDMYLQFTHMVHYYPNNELVEMGTAADQFMYKLLVSNGDFAYKHLTNSEGLLREVGRASKIMVYGAGNVAIEVVQLLKNNNISVDKILVSDKQVNYEQIMDVPVYEFDEYEIEENTIIVIAIWKRNEKAINDVVKKIRSVTNVKLVLYDGTIV